MVKDGFNNNLYEGDRVVYNNSGELAIGIFKEKRGGKYIIDRQRTPSRLSFSTQYARVKNARSILKIVDII